MATASARRNVKLTSLCGGVPTGLAKAFTLARHKGNTMQVTTATDWNSFTKKWRGLLISHRDPDVGTTLPLSSKEKDAAQLADWETEGGKGKAQA